MTALVDKIKHTKVQSKESDHGFESDGEKFKHILSVHDKDMKNVLGNDLILANLRALSDQIDEQKYVEDTINLAYKYKRFIEPLSPKVAQEVFAFIANKAKVKCLVTRNTKGNVLVRGTMESNTQSMDNEMYQEEMMKQRDKMGGLR